MGWLTRSTLEELRGMPETEWGDFLAEVANGGSLEELCAVRRWAFGGLHRWLVEDAGKKRELDAALAARKGASAERVFGLWNGLLRERVLQPVTRKEQLSAARDLAKAVGLLRDGAGTVSISFGEDFGERLRRARAREEEDRRDAGALPGEAVVLKEPAADDGMI